MRTYIDEQGHKIVRMTLEERGSLSEEQKERLRNARNHPQEYDPDCPPMLDAIRAADDTDYRNKLIVEYRGRA